MNYTFTNDDVLLVEKLIEIKNKGYYCDGGQLTQVYNRVLKKNAPVTNCGSCMRARICELEGALNNFKEKMANEVVSSHSESVEDIEHATMKVEENKASEEPKKATRAKIKK